MGYIQGAAILQESGS